MLLRTWCDTECWLGINCALFSVDQKTQLCSNEKIEERALLLIKGKTLLSVQRTHALVSKLSSVAAAIGSATNGSR